MMRDHAPPAESDAAYYRRRAAAERKAAGCALTNAARRLHGVLAETYGELGMMLDGDERLDEQDRMLVGLAIAGGLARTCADDELRRAHQRIAQIYRFRLNERRDLPEARGSRQAAKCRAP